MTRRLARVEEEIRSQVAELLAREVKDPRVGFVTVTRVSLAADLQHAKVYVGVLGGTEQRETALRVLRGAAGFVRRELGRRIRMRRTPELAFVYDRGLDATERVSQLLAELEPSAADDGADDGPEGD